MLFDWGGTLTPHYEVDFVGNWRCAASLLAPAERVEEVAQALLDAEMLTWQQTVEGFLSTRTEAIIAGVVDHFNLDADTDSHSAALTAYLTAWTPHTFVRKETVEVLAQLRERGLVTGLLSNTHWPSHWHERWLERDGVVGLLDRRVYTCELTHLKPHALAFETLLDMVQVPANEAVFVGDRQLDDIDGANALGMRTVHIDNGITPAGISEPTARITQLAELIEWVDQWR